MCVILFIIYFSYLLTILLFIYVIMWLYSLTNLTLWLLKYKRYFYLIILLIIYCYMMLYLILYTILNLYFNIIIFYLWIVNYYFLLFYFPFIFIFLLITLVTLIFCFTYNKNELNAFFYYIIIIWIAGIGLFYTNSLIYFFLFYEILLIPSFLILYNYAKTRKCIEAAFLMFFWTQFGALWLLFGFIYLFFITQTYYFTTYFLIEFSSFQLNFIYIIFICGFGVKFPIWPFYDWLPKAHVEASTNFSIFLSGVLVKFAFFGFLKCILSFQLEPTLYYIFPIIFIGIIDSVTKIYYQIDLKKLIAYATVIEMHWLLLIIFNGQSVLWIVAFYMLISHALISSNFFLLIDSVTRRFKTRLITEITGLIWLVPLLYLLILILLITFLGFPGSIFFLAEIYFFLFFFDINIFWTLNLLIILYCYFGICFFKNWFLFLFNYSFYFTSSFLIKDL
jgi:NADH-quinone oxidoreductase subunit M